MILMTRKPREKQKRDEPHVGIFWMISGRLIIDSTPISSAEAYGDFRIHSGDHQSVWENLQLSGRVPLEMEYQEAPRGRVMFGVKTRRFTLLAEKCILRNEKVVKEIMSVMNLPSQKINIDTDGHYLCHACQHDSSDVR
jgi:hypothetical protein